jgi:hypothetical protein
LRTLDQQSRRTIRERLDEKHLALFDLLIKPMPGRQTIDR